MLPAKGNDERNADNRARHNIGKHGNRVNGVVEGIAPPYHEVGNEHRDHNDDGQRAEGDGKGVADRAPQQPSDGIIVV